MPFRLATLGRCNLENEDGNVINVPTQSLFIAAYLFDIGRRVARRDIANLFWPGGGETALTNLRSTLRRFTLATAHASMPLITIEASSLSLNRQMVRCDMDLSAHSDPVHRLQAASGAVAMQFLPSLGEGKAPLDIWVRDVRLRMLSALRAEFMQFAATAGLRPQDIVELRRAAVLLLEANPQDHDIRQHLCGNLPRTETTVHAQAPMPRETGLFQAANVNHVQPRIALLPPQATKDAGRDGSIANALIEDLTIGLCSSRFLSVVAPYTSERIQASKDKAALLEKHNVVYALDSRRNDRQLFVQLIFTPTEEVIWASRFELSADSISTHCETISQTIQSELKSRIGSHQSSVGDFSRRPEAYFLYLKGLQSLSSISLPSIRRARKYFREALDHGSDLSEALAGMSRTFSMEWILTARGDDELLTKAEHYAECAITENERFASGFKELGVSRLFMGRIDDSLDALSQAERLSPESPDILCSYADSLIHGSDPATALVKIKHAMSLNSVSPDMYYWTAAGASYFLHNYQEALDYIGKMSNKRPAARLAAACYGMMGEVDKARVFRARVFEDNPIFDLDRWLSVIPHKEPWQTEIYREGLKRAGF